MDTYIERVKIAETLLRKYQVDTWLIATREGSDQSVQFLLGIRSVSLAFIFIRSNGEHIVLTSKSDQGNYDSTGLFRHVYGYVEDAEDLFLRIWNHLRCSRLALNTSELDEMSGGLSQGLYEMLQNIIGEDLLAEIEVNSKEFMTDLIDSTKKLEEKK